jgi:hypothetical protein
MKHIYTNTAFVQHTHTHTNDDNTKTTKTTPPETEAESRVRSLSGEALRTAFKQLDQTYDDARGGFGRRLKFPRPSELNFLVCVCVCGLCLGVSEEGRRMRPKWGSININWFLFPHFATTKTHTHTHTQS